MPIFPQTPYVIFRMTGINSNDPNQTPVFWTSRGTPDFTGQFSGYPVGSIKDIEIDGEPINQVPSSQQYNVPTGPASGDLAGNYPSPTVAKIDGYNLPSPSGTNTVLTYNGTALNWSVATSGTFVAGQDLSGTSSAQTVIGLQGKLLPGIGSGSPSGNLYWNSINQDWELNTSGGSGFTAGGDLSGNDTSQQVAQISGATGNLNFAANKSTPVIGQLQQTSNVPPNNLSINAQYAYGSATGSNQYGGSLGLGAGKSANGNQGAGMVFGGGSNTAASTSSELLIDVLSIYDTVTPRPDLRFTLNAGSSPSFNPGVNNVGTLGTSSYQWNNVYASTITVSAVGSNALLCGGGAFVAPITTHDTELVTSVGGNPAFTKAVDLSVVSSNLTVTGLLGTALPTTGTGYLNWNGSAWVFTTGGGAPSGSAGGDLFGSYPNPYVKGLLEYALPPMSQGPGNLTCTGAGWTLTQYPTFSNDLTGTNTSQTVVGLYGFPLPNLNHAGGTGPLTWNSTNNTWSINTVSVSNGGLGINTVTPNAIVVGAGTSPVTTISPGASGNVLTSNGTAWVSAAAPSGFTAGNDLSGSSTSQTVNGLRSMPLPTIGYGYLEWTGSAWAFGAGGSGSGSVPTPTATNEVFVSTGTTSSSYNWATTIPASSIPNTAVMNGTYGDNTGDYAGFTVGTDGRLTSAAQYTLPVKALYAGTGISVSNSSGTWTVADSTTGVSAGSYSHPTLFVNAAGKITSISSNSLPVTSLVAGTGISVSNSSGTWTITNTGGSGLPPGTGLVVVNSGVGSASTMSGDATFAASTGALTVSGLQGSALPGVGAGSPAGALYWGGYGVGWSLNTNLTGGTVPTPGSSNEILVSGSGSSYNWATTIPAASIPNTAVMNGTYGDFTSHYAGFTVGTDGRITSAIQYSLPVTSIYPGTNVSVSHIGGVWTVNSTAASLPSGTGIVTVNSGTGSAVTMGGDATFNTTNGTLTLSSVGGGAATYGDTTHYATFTVDAKGRVTSASQAALPSVPVTSIVAGTNVTVSQSGGAWTVNSSGGFGLSGYTASPLTGDGAIEPMSIIAQSAYGDATQNIWGANLNLCAGSGAYTETGYDVIIPASLILGGGGFTSNRQNSYLYSENLTLANTVNSTITGQTNSITFDFQNQQIRLSSDNWTLAAWEYPFVNIYTTSLTLGGITIPAPSGTNTVLSYNGSTCSWSAPSGGFTAGGDLSGSASSQTVVGIRGTSVPSPSTGYLQYNGSSLVWNNALLNTGAQYGLAVWTSQYSLSNITPPASSGLVLTSVNSGYPTWSAPAVSSIVAGTNTSVSNSSGAWTVNNTYVSPVTSLVGGTNVSVSNNSGAWTINASQPTSLTVGGDISGTTSNATVVKLDGYSLPVLTGSGNLNWNGSSWVLMSTLITNSHTNIITSSYTVNSGATPDKVILCNASAGITVTLPLSPSAGDTYKVKDKSGAANTNNITVSGNGKNIDGAASFVMNRNYQSAELIYDGSSWSIL